MITKRRPSTATCRTCGDTTFLVDCGVPEHRRTRTRREQLDGRCPGRVYIHQSTWGIDAGEWGKDWHEAQL